ncbi:Carbon-nitrogen hydrolase [Phaffia rhodozyma]|uniref:Carbon-nitrogen hydrolase n=1 Tax=Phaffia rhodozyma TaxID=264483 RepID=A0A0F7SHF0_PHARH|nr:Carbon-nitrogen hydrolase [Phaffia rhodozyma]
MAAVQAEPVWGDLQGSVRKTVALIEEAASKGIKTDSEEMNTIRRACAANDIWVLVGYAEKKGSSMWMSTSWINNQGEVVGHRRKLQPTGVERVIFGNASGDTVNNVIESPFGRLGSLQCWEHAQPLLKYHTASLHEQIHAASWPCLFPHMGPEHSGMSKEGTLALNQAYSMETGAFSLVATCVMTEAGAKSMGFTPEMLAVSFLALPGGGASRIIGPDGRVLAGADLPGDTETLLTYDIDLAEIEVAKQLMDCVGHYSRPDVFRLQVANQHNAPVHYHSINSKNLPLPAPIQGFPTLVQKSSTESSFDLVDATSLMADA